MKGLKIVNGKFTTTIWPLLAGAAILCAVAPAKAADKKPNIVFMLMDNLGYGELGVYGGGILRGAPTPRIDKLASEGMRLLNFNVESQCTPSRSALMTGRFPIRSGTYKVPLGRGPDGLTLWEVTIAELLSARGYATGTWGKWHLGSAEARFPTHQGFDEWYGIPRTYDEAMWPSLNETNSMWPSVGDKQGWNANVVSPEYIYEAHKGEKARQVAELNVDRRRTIEAEITSHAVDFIKRNANAAKPFFAYVSFSLVHFPTLPNPEFAGKTGNGDWADCLAEMDYRTGQILDAIKQAGAEENTIVIFTSDNGPEATHPWDGDSGPWRGTYFTAMEASLRFPAYVADRLSAVKWRNWKVHFIWQQNMYDPPLALPLPKVINLLTDLKEERDGFPWYNSWVVAPVTKIVADFEESLKKYPPIKIGTPDPYFPPGPATSGARAERSNNVSPR